MATTTRNLATALALALALSGCITVQGPGIKPSTIGTASTKPGAPKPNAATLKEKPKAGGAAAQEKLKESGGVAIAFKGLAPTRNRASGGVKSGAGQPGASGAMASNAGTSASGRGLRQLLQTTAEIARVEVTVTGPRGYSRTQSMTREQLMAPMVTMFFDAVPVGQATLSARVFDQAGGTIGDSRSDFDVERAEVTEVALNVKLQATGGVSATIGFEDADVEGANITGYWVVGTGTAAPPYPMSGCGEGYVWFVTQYGDSVRASVSGYNDESSPDARHRGMYWSEEAFGTIHQNRVRMTGRIDYTDENGEMAAPSEAASYELFFDPNAYQMKGTRNGEAGWAVPYFFDCPAPAPTTGPVMPVPFTPPPLIGRPEPLLPGRLAPRMIEVTGQLFDHRGAPDPMAELEFYPWNSDETFRAQVNPNGSFSVRVPVDTDLEFMAWGRDGYVTRGFTMFYDLGERASATFDVWMDPPPGLAIAPSERPDAAPTPWVSASPEPWTSPSPAPSWTATPWMGWTPEPSAMPSVTPSAAPSAAPAVAARPSPAPTALGLMTDTGLRNRWRH